MGEYTSQSHRPGGDEVIINVCDKCNYHTSNCVCKRTKKVRRKLDNPEERFQKEVMRLAKLNGWRSAHFRKSMTKRGNWVTAVAGDGKGFPDLVLVRERVIVVELKATTKPTDDQLLWHEAFRAAGIDVYVWYPSDIDEVIAVLSTRLIRKYHPICEHCRR